MPIRAEASRACSGSARRPRPDRWRTLNGHSYVAFIGADASNAVTGNFELHHVPAGTYDLILVTPNYDGIVAGVEVVSGQVTDVGLRRVCIID